MLKLQFRDRRQEAIWLVDPLFTIGRSPENSLVINEPGISDLHAEIRNANNQTTIVSKNSSTNIYINDVKVINEKPLAAGDVIKLGKVELDVIDPHSTQYQSALGLKPSKSPDWKLKSTASWMEDQIFPINKVTSLGRDAACDISIPVEHLSRRHVEVEVKGGKLLVRDLDSANGTFLNGQRITESYAKSGDKIKLDVITFEVIGPAEDPNKTIIRSAPTTPDNAPKPAAPTLNATAKTPPKHKHKVKQPTEDKGPQQRPLASGGKQAWIKEPKPANSHRHYGWYAIGGFAITLLAAVFYFSQK